MYIGWLFIPFAATAQNSKLPAPAPPLSVNKGRLQYTPDSLGNRIPDFSYCGYYGGDKPIPDVPVRILVPVKAGDATYRIQAALDYVGSLPADAAGIRGAVLLQAGMYEVGEGLVIQHSGVVLRGSGFGENGTILKATGKDRETLIRITGADNMQPAYPIPIKDQYVPLNSKTIHSGAGIYKPGAEVMITRTTSAEWIKELGTGHFGGGITATGWKPATRNMRWYRKVVAENNGTVELDAPITMSLDKAYGEVRMSFFSWPGRTVQAGVENLRCVSDYDTTNPKDEAHRWMAITIENTTDAWVRQVVTEHFAGSAVYITETANRITVEDCKYLSPVSEIGGERRNAFFTAGQQTLFQRCYSEYAIHDFATGFCAAGPNAFVQCESFASYGFSGALDSWACGVLFDDVRVDGQAISFMNRGQDGNGAGWCAANSVFWNCSAARIDCYRPPMAQNWSFGSWAQFSGDGYWAESNNSLEPRSLYYAQLLERLGDKAKDRAQLLIIETDATSSPTVEQAKALTAESVKPMPTIAQFIDGAKQRHSIPIDATGIKAIDDIQAIDVIAAPSADMKLENGWLAYNGAVLTGKRFNVPWWSGAARPANVHAGNPAITRFVPGRVGMGLTDDLNELTDSMQQWHRTVLEQNYGLWYDRRRDDHERVRRTDGDVWPPFYELPFARSGYGKAWDGLSKYDLTKYNYWYWNRLKNFATLAGQKGLVLVHQNYFQHNIIEAGAHYADFPWRPVNNINNTGFPEPPPYAGDKRIFMAEQFYDTTHPVRRALHRAYIRQCLDNFKFNSNVIQFIGEEYTGPLHFVQFWLNVIKEWEAETGRKVIVGLSTTKDVQDAILQDEARASVVDVIDIRYWHYQEDGSAYAPAGGQNLAPRQHARLLKPKRSTFDQVYRAVKEYRSRYAGKAVMYSGDNYDNLCWAAFMAGGSLAALPETPKEFLYDATAMKPMELPAESKGLWLLGNEKGYIVYSNAYNNLSLDFLPATGTFRVRWIDPKTGELIGKEQKLSGGKKLAITKPVKGDVLLWLTKN